jgi:hypothetical protein
MKKTTIYIDIDDDIAAIIDKLNNADQKIVALVLPKRPSALQGSVNLQLLKKSAEDSAKNLVLITSDDQVVRLAGQTGLHVSSSLQSKPFIPKVDEIDDSKIEELSDDAAGGSKSDMASDPAQPDVYADGEKVDLTTPIGVLVGDDEIELDNSDPVEGSESAKDSSEKKVSAIKKIKVPNFGKFRTKMIAGGLGALLLGLFLFWALAIAPKATINISTEKSDLQAKITLTASKDTAVVDAEKGLIPATRKEDKQKLTGTFAATGQKDVGEKASGTITIRNCDYPDGFTLPAGTRFTNSGKAFVSTASVSVPDFSGPSFLCSLDGDESGKANVAVVAESPGDSFNLSSRGYAISSIPAEADVDAVGGAMGGGTTKIAKIVSAEDIEAAKSKVLEASADNVKGKLAQLLKDESLLPIEETFLTAQGEPSSSVAVGAEATADPTLTIEVTSSMLGMKFSDVEPLINKELEKNIDSTTQKIYSAGLDAAVLAVVERPGPDTVKLTIATSSSIGPNLSPENVASDIAGKKAGEAKQLLESRPGVSRADIRLSPFWVFSLPSKTSKIAVTINE